MAFTCGFFNSDRGDRKYNAEQISAIFDGIIADGVFATIGDHMMVTAGTGMQVLVGTGKAWFDHTWNVNDSLYSLEIEKSDVSLDRIDAVVLETNHSDSVRFNGFKVIQGAVSSTPVKPTLTNTETIHQHPLAWVRVTAGATAITASMIENVVGKSECPFVTGVVEVTNIDDIFNQWNGEFDEWFANLKTQLSGDVAANLQRQIDENRDAVTLLRNSAVIVDASDKIYEPYSYNMPINFVVTNSIPVGITSNTSFYHSGIIYTYWGGRLNIFQNNMPIFPPRSNCTINNETFNYADTVYYDGVFFYQLYYLPSRISGASNYRLKACILKTKDGSDCSIVHTLFDVTSPNSNIWWYIYADEDGIFLNVRYLNTSNASIEKYYVIDGSSSIINEVSYFNTFVKIKDDLYANRYVSGSNNGASINYATSRFSQHSTINIPEAIRPGTSYEMYWILVYLDKYYLFPLYTPGGGSYISRNDLKKSGVFSSSDFVSWAKDSKFESLYNNDFRYIILPSKQRNRMILGNSSKQFYEITSGGDIIDLGNLSDSLLYGIYNSIDNYIIGENYQYKMNVLLAVNATTLGVPISKISGNVMQTMTLSGNIPSLIKAPFFIKSLTGDTNYGSIFLYDHSATIRNGNGEKLANATCRTFGNTILFGTNDGQSAWTTLTGYVEIRGE